MTHPAGGTKLLASFKNPPRCSRIPLRRKIRYFYRSAIFFFFLNFTSNTMNELFRGGLRYDPKERRIRGLIPMRNAEKNHYQRDSTIREFYSRVLRTLSTNDTQNGGEEETRGFDLVLATKRGVPLDYTLTKEEEEEEGGWGKKEKEEAERATKRGRLAITEW